MSTTALAQPTPPTIRRKKEWTEIDVANGDESGILLTQGGLFGGYALMLEAGKPKFDYNLVGVARYQIASDKALAPGKHTVAFDFRYDGGGIGKGGTGTLSVDGEQVAQGRIERTIPIRIALDETLDVGEDTGTPVSRDYDVPFNFTGKLDKVTIELQ